MTAVKLVLLSADERAAFGWRKFKDASGQKGINCAFFRNEGAFDGMLSSELILAAEKLAWTKWPDERLYTYVSPDTSDNPGYTFKKAGWGLVRTKNGKPLRTKARNLYILEKWAAK